MSKADLKLDWCSYQAAKWAVEHWHYSHSMPVPPLVRIGAWEESAFIGVVLFSRGASTNLLKPYGLLNTEGCELTRVALTNHISHVSRIVSIAIKMLSASNPGLRLIVSYADPLQDHIGGIYQAGNWIYTGTSSPDRAWIDDVTGKKYHSRLVSENGSGYRKQFGVLRKSIPSEGKRRIITPGKYRYLYPLDPAMRAQIEPLRKPYPKRGPGEIDSAASTNLQTGGASPTDPLSMNGEAILTNGT